MGNFNRLPRYTTGFWSDMRGVDIARDSDKKCKLMALSYVKLFYSKCPSPLQFVRIYDWAWQIITTSRADLELYEMSRAETISMGLFAFDAVNLVDGLLVTRLPTTWKGER